jgi:hypothetical protein
MVLQPIGVDHLTEAALSESPALAVWLEWSARLPENSPMSAELAGVAGRLKAQGSEPRSN